MPRALPVLEPQCRPALAAAHAANPALATLAQALRAPLLSAIGYAELVAQAESAAESRRWAGEMLTASRELLAVLDCVLALAAGRTPPCAASPDAVAAAEDSIAALRCLLAPKVGISTDGCGDIQRQVV